MRDFLFVLLVTLLVLVPSGVGGIGFQRRDWLKHNAVLNTLSTHSWPAACEYSEEGASSHFLTYYIAYYLPAAAVGRLWGLTAANLALFAWTLAGMLLCGLWVTRLVGGYALLVMVAWYSLSGMDAAGMFLSGGNKLEFWCGFWQYPANMSLMVWVPQHMLPGWLAMALIVHETEEYRDLSLAGFIGALTSLWSPFVTIGLMPIGLVLLLRARWQSLWTLPNLVAAPAIVMTAVAFLKSIETQEVPKYFIFEAAPWSMIVPLWFLFCLIEFGIYALLIAPDVLKSRCKDPQTPWTFSWFLIATGTLLVLPIYVLGKYNDLAMRASIPCLFLFWLVLLRTFVEGGVSLRNWRGRVLVACLILGAIAPAYTWLRHLQATRPWLQYFASRADVSIHDIPEEVLSQYLGRTDSFFFQYMARDSAYPALDPDNAAAKHVQSDGVPGAPPASLRLRHGSR